MRGGDGDRANVTAGGGDAPPGAPALLPPQPLLATATPALMDDQEVYRGRNVTGWWRYLFGLAVAPVCLAFMNFPLAFEIAESSAQVSAQQPSTEYATHFLDRPPTPAELSHVPANARDVVVAKVRLVEPLRYFSNRDRSGLPQRPPPSSEIFFARIEIIEALQGATSAGSRHDVYFGERDAVPNYKYPRPRWPLSREYFVASYISPDGKRRLLAFQVSEEEYRAWTATRFGRQRPGAGAMNSDGRN